MLSKDRLIFDPTDMPQSDQVGAFLIGAAGEVATMTTIAGKVTLDVNVVGDADDGIFSEDSAAASGDKGQSILAVRQDALISSVSADGDYGHLKFNARGGLWSVPVGSVADDEADTENPVKVGSRAVLGALSAVSSTNDRADLISDLYRRVFVNTGPNVALSSPAVVTVGVLEVALPVAALAGRRKLIVQNTSNNDIFVGSTGVSTTNGIRVGKGDYWEVESGPNHNWFAIAAGAGNAVRVVELA